LSLSSLTGIPFFDSCPVCGAKEASEVVTFPELRFVRCAGCGLIYKQEQVRGLGTGYGEDFFRHNRAGYMKRWEHRVCKCRRQLLVCLEYSPHARRVLDVGCSAGYVLAAAKSLGLEEMGLDYERFPVDLCREKGLRAVQGTLTELPLADNSLDIVTAKHTLEHVDDPLRGLREIHRVLRPGGVALIVVPDAAYYKIPLMPRRGARSGRTGAGGSTTSTSTSTTSPTRVLEWGLRPPRLARTSSAAGWRRGLAPPMSTRAMRSWSAGCTARG
jgi:SAM-dependent methyltransferase